MFQQIKKWLNRVVWLICIVLLCAAGLLLLATRFSIPGGFRLYAVLSGSMTPTIPVGSLVISKFTITEVKKGDIITFEEIGSQRLITHRVVEVKPDGVFITKGDANPTADVVPVMQSHIRGVYVKHVPRAGTVLEFIKSPRGLVPFVILPTLILIILELQSVVTILVDRKVKKIQGALLILVGIMWCISGSSYAAFISKPVTLNTSRMSTTGHFSTSHCGSDIVINQSNKNTGTGSVNKNEVNIDVNCL